MNRVLCGVFEHAWSERSHRPVGALMLFVELHTKEMFEQRCESERADAKQLRGDPRIEDVAHVPGVILLQEAQIVIRVVEHDLDGGRLKEMPELRGRADRQRIDDRRALARRELEQIDSVDEAMEARTFGVER